MTTASAVSRTTPKSRAPDDWRHEIVDVLMTLYSVEGRRTLPESNQRSAVAALGMDPPQAQLRQVYFFDTPDLALYQAGLVLRVRRVQNRGADSVVAASTRSARAHSRKACGAPSGSSSRSTQARTVTSAPRR